MQGAFCRAPNGGRRGGLSDGALVAKDRAHRRAPWLSVRYFKKATASDRCWEWAGESICEWARRGFREWAKIAIPDATPKTPTPIAL